MYIAQVPPDNALVLGNLREYHNTWYIARFFGLHFCRRKYRCIFNHFYAMGPESYRIWWNNARWRPLRRSRSLKFIDVSINRKHIRDFLLVITTNLYPILHRFQVMADYWSNFR